MKFAVCFTVGAAIMLALPAFSAQLPGKAVYDKTCKNCHGDRGTGSPTADQFYKVKIPRLNSAYVQSKSDSEIKEIITGGKGKMPAVRKSDSMASPARPTTMGVPPPSDPHAKKLDPGEVDDVIAYVRTFTKKK
jgi:mono/diheme cytochrome c family protein